MFQKVFAKCLYYIRYILRLLLLLDILLLIAILLVLHSYTIRILCVSLFLLTIVVSEGNTLPSLCPHFCILLIL